MDLFTSYYANLKKIPMDYAAIGISIVCPDWLKGDKSPSNFYFWDDNLFAPSIDLLSDIKSNRINQSVYTIRYYKELNERFHFKSDNGRSLISYIDDLKRRFFDYSAIVFLCYEKPTEFCHRHLIRELLLYYSVSISELPYDKNEDKSKETTSKIQTSNSDPLF